MENNSIVIRPAASSDFEALYALAKDTPELKMSTMDDFMSPEEFKRCMRDPNGIFLIAEAHGICAGFIYISREEIERPHPEQWARLSYLAVDSAFRKRGIATLLYEEAEKRLRAQGIMNIYSWAHAGGDEAMLGFMKRHGFNEGNVYRYMDKKI